MKEYKYKINGNLYKVSVGDIDGKICARRSKRHALYCRAGKRSGS